MTDGDLLARYVGGSSEAFEQIVIRHADMVYAVCLRMLNEEQAAEDTAQATFLLLTRKAASLPKNTLLSGWLYLTARNMSREYRRSSLRRHKHEREAAKVMTNHKSKEDEWEQMRPWLDSALEELPAPQREALVLRFFSGLSEDDAAREAGCPAKTLRTRLSRGLDSLRGLLQRRTVVSSSIVLAALLTHHGVRAAPPLLHNTIVNACLGKVAASAAAVGLSNAVANAAFVAQAKIVAVSLAVILSVSVPAIWAFRSNWNPPTSTVTPNVPAANPAVSPVMPVSKGIVLVSAMKPNSWLSVPRTQLRQIVPDPTGEKWGNPRDIVTSWSGGALDSRRNRLIVWGGGTSSYKGNELYAFEIDTLSWRRLTEPTPYANPDKEMNADGTPKARSTYNGLAYIEHADCFFASAGCMINRDMPTTMTWAFDFKTNKWQSRAPSSNPGGGYGSNCSYDPVTRKVWWGSAAGSFAGLWSYDYDTNKWAKHNEDHFYDYSSAVDTKRGQFVVVGDGKLVAYNIVKGDLKQNVVMTKGGETFLAFEKPGFDYDPTADRFIGWNGGAVYVLDLATKVWSSFNPPGAPETTYVIDDQKQGYQTGIYGRWRYVPRVNAFILVTSIDENVHFYKPPAVN